MTTHVPEPLEPLSWGATTLAASFRFLIPAALHGGLPAPVVDCEACRRVEEGSADPRVKCCDIVPRLPNFLVGELLKVGAPSVVRWINQGIEAGRGDPFGLQVPPVISARYLAARRAHDAGRFGLPCPLLQDGRCSIYARRPPPCADYHCYYKDALHREAQACASSALMLLTQTAERELVCAYGFDLQIMAGALLLEDDVLWDGESIAPEAYGALWQHFQGRERAFYQGCFERLSGFEPVEVGEAQAPNLAQRERYREGAVPAHNNALSVEAQLRVLRWYLARLAPKRPSVLKIFS